MRMRDAKTFEMVLDRVSLDAASDDFFFLRLRYSRDAITHPISPS